MPENNNAYFIIGGNYNFALLKTALSLYDIQLTRWNSSDNDKSLTGFLICTGSHYYTIRKLNGVWFYLNSTLSMPQVLANFNIADYQKSLPKNYLIFCA